MSAEATAAPAAIPHPHSHGCSAARFPTWDISCLSVLPSVIIRQFFQAQVRCLLEEAKSCERKLRFTSLLVLPPSQIFLRQSGLYCTMAYTLLFMGLPMPASQLPRSPAPVPVPAMSNWEEAVRTEPGSLPQILVGLLQYFRSPAHDTHNTSCIQPVLRNHWPCLGQGESHCFFLEHCLGSKAREEEAWDSTWELTHPGFRSFSTSQVPKTFSVNGILCTLCFFPSQAFYN